VSGLRMNGVKALLYPFLLAGSSIITPPKAPMSRPQ
jgi:hypothetical protein